MPNVRKLKGDITEDTIYISWDNRYDIATLTRRTNDAGEHEYVFIVDWEAWDTVKPCYGIPGLNMDARLDEYVRYDKPVFVFEKMPPPYREDYPDLLRQFNLPPGTDTWDFMIACTRYTNDRWRVHR